MLKIREKTQNLMDYNRKVLEETKLQIEQREKIFENMVVENKEEKELIRKIKTLVESNKYNKPNIILNKIKELLRPVNVTNSK